MFNQIKYVQFKHNKNNFLKFNHDTKIKKLAYGGNYQIEA